VPTSPKAEARDHGSTYPLLGILVVLLVASPLLPDVGAPGLVLDLFLTGVIFAAFWVVHRDRRRLVGVAAAGASALVLLWTAHATGATSLLVAALLVFASTLGYVVTALLLLVLRARRVSLDTVSGAIAAYLLLAHVWAAVFGLVELLAPGSLRGGGGAPVIADAHPLEATLYFALVTLTTVGYGDIVPVTPLARNLAALCAVSGQMYVAVLVAALVARFVAHQSREDG
jgi:hypothetical protein